MRDLFEEHQAYTLAGQALPTPTDTPYTRSRRSSRHETPTPSNPSSSPPPLPPDFGKDNAPNEDDEEFSMLDPRRFTPTLHASLVSEILSLRRELDSKHRFIENLEHNLQDSRSETETLQERLTETSKENRSAKRQLKQVEDGTLAALQELASERDDLKGVQQDLRHKLEASQKQAKTQEQDAERAYNVHMSEKQGWENEKRGLERRVHASENRLKTFINEVNAQHAAEFGPELGDVSETEEDARDSGLGNDSDVPSAQSSPARQRPTRDRSSSSTRRSSTRQSNRFSLDSALGSGRQSRQHGLSLADELVFDEEEEDLDDLEEIEDAYADRETRLRRARESRQSFNQDDKAKRVLGLSNGRESSDHYDSLEYERRDLIRPIQEMPTSKEEEHSPVMPMNLPYVDAGIQYSPPTSPTLPIMIPTSPPTSPEAVPILQEKVTPPAEVEANQSRKRIASPVRSPSPKPRKLTSEKPAALPVALVSSATQTIEDFPAPAPVADAAIQATPPDVETLVQPSYNSISTQTDSPKEEAVNQCKNERSPVPASLVIPSIAIHPPLSSPPSPKEAVLPPATKNAGCQVSLENRIPTTDSGTQTERITIDQRILKLPPHLWPSAIRDKDLRSVEASQGSRERSPFTIGKQDLGSESRPTLQSSALPKEARSSLPLTEDRYPGNNDNGPLAKDVAEGPRRPFRSASLFAGFNDEDGGDETDLDESDSQSKSRIAPKPTSVNRLTRNGFSFSDPPTPVPEEKESPRSDVQKEKHETSIPKEDVEERVAESFVGGRNSLERAPRIMKPIRMASMVKQPNLRRSSLIANGTTAHLRRGSKTPSERSFGSASMSSTVAPPPPFPVPQRSSSRRVWQTRSEGSYSPTPGQNGMHSGRRPLADAAKQHPGKDALRKVRSANVIPRHARRGSHPRSRSPPNSLQSSMPSSITSPTLLEHEIPELPRDNIKSPRHVFQLQKSNSRAAQSDVTSRTGSASVGSGSQQQSTVVDAIAITMVGEWMWKYVRRRKSFGVPESPAEVSRPGEDGSITVTSNGGQRHKRWVWLSPYERAVMWSSKQPSSNSALMGKSGRKLIIQSVLDVKDDTPLPKNAGNIFNRSILILTPARALKFTAFSSERHYLWLTALSFLSHHPSQRLSPLPAIPAPEPKTVKPPSSETPSTEPKIPIPEKELEKPTRATAMLRRTPLRDSVRIAKSRGGISSRGRPGGPTRNATAPPTLPEFRESFDVGVEQEIHSATGATFFDQIHSNPPPAEYRFADLPSTDHLRPNTAGTTGTADTGAEYPNVPRYHGHGRKRSASGPVAPSSRDLQPVPSSGRLGSLRGWTQWPEKLSSRPMSRDGGGGASGDPPRLYADLNESTTTIAPPPIPITRPRSRTSDQHHAPHPSNRPSSRPPLPTATSAPPPQMPGQPPPPPPPPPSSSSRSGSRNGMMRMEAFVQPPTQLARVESEPSSASVPAPAAVVPERIRTGRRLPGFVPRRRSKVPEAWTKGVVVGSGGVDGGDGEGGLADPFRGF
ncbi:MAG: hypothetical protein Q9165_001498 [Trypethelium subeluteriae]